MDEGKRVSRDEFFMFIRKYETAVGPIECEIGRPYTYYSSQDGTVLAMIHDKSCGGDPDEIGRDHFINTAFLNFRTPAEIKEANRQGLLSISPSKYDSLVIFEQKIIELNSKEMSGTEYFERYMVAVQTLATPHLEKAHEPDSKNDIVVLPKKTRKKVVKKTVRKKAGSKTKFK